ncbi:MAG: hypothetical protein HQL46_06625, partial [Gammaproteobacteria bacterium]|nr:hypothetical protein [Gammaproteobacteria bacterium]
MIDLDILFENIPKVDKIKISKLKKPDIERWFKDLRMVNQYKTLKEIEDNLLNTNSLKIEVEERLYLLDLIYEPVISISGHFKKDYLNSNLPLSENKKQKFDQCVRVYEQLVIGYSIILFEQINNKKLWSFLGSKYKKIHIHILQAMIRLLSQLVLSYYEIYAHPPATVWKQLLTIFNYAEQKKIHNLFALDKMLHEQTTISLTFLQPLLLALSDPFHFEQQQTYFIYKHLAQWAKFVKISTKDESGNPDYLAINMLDNYMPTFEPRGQIPEEHTIIYVNTNDLSIQDINAIEAKSNGYLSPFIKESLFRNMKQSISSVSERNFERKKFKSKVKVYMGLNNIHYVLNDFNLPNWMTDANFELVDNDISYAHAQQFSSSNPVNKNLGKYDFFLTEDSSMNGLSLIWTHEQSLEDSIHIKVG